MAMKKETGGKYHFGHDNQPKGKSIGVPHKVVDSMPKGGGLGWHGILVSLPAIALVSRREAMK